MLENYDLLNFLLLPLALVKVSLRLSIMYWLDLTHQTFISKTSQTSAFSQLS